VRQKSIIHESSYKIHFSDNNINVKGYKYKRCEYISTDKEGDRFSQNGKNINFVAEMQQKWPAMIYF